MPNRKEELLAMLKSNLKQKVNLFEPSLGAKCCDQIVEYVDYKDIPESPRISNESKHNKDGKKNVEKTGKKQKSSSKVDTNEENVSINSAKAISVVVPKTVHLDKDTSNWAKKTEEFLMKLQNMEAYSGQDEKVTSTGKSKDLESKKRKSKSQSRRSESPESPLPKRKVDDKTSCPRETRSGTEDRSKRPESKLKKISKSDSVSKSEIWETIQALKREIAKLEKKRREMSSKSFKQHEKTIADALNIEQEMRNQIRDLWKVIIGTSEDKTNAPQNAGELTRETLILKEQNPSSNQSVKTTSGAQTRFIMTFNKPRLPSAASTAATRDVQCSTASVDWMLQDKADGLDIFGRTSSRDAMTEKDNPMANAMSEGVKYATSLYLKAANFYDGGNLWCQVCNTLHKTIWELSLHLHSQEHLQKSDYEDKNPESDDKISITSESAPARGDEFFRPIRAYNCLLCKCILNDSVALGSHFTSKAHNLKFQEFLSTNKEYEVPYLTHKMAVILRKELLKDARTLPFRASDRKDIPNLIP